MADRIDTTRLTNEVGNPVADNNHTLTAGERGPMTVSYTHLTLPTTPYV